MSAATSGPGPKIKEFELTPEITQMGFVSARVINGCLTLRHKSGGAIRCDFDNKKISAFKKKLENAIAANENGVKFDSNNFDSRKFVIKFIDLLVDDVEKEHERYELAQSGKILARKNIKHCAT
ncbi:MAG TPA: hypothetical protein VIP70_13285 [Nitrososphaeraceae archaeon]